jgi:hypothetical protein
MTTKVFVDNFKLKGKTMRKDSCGSGRGAKRWCKLYKNRSKNNQ